MTIDPKIEAKRIAEKIDPGTAAVPELRERAIAVAIKQYVSKLKTSECVEICEGISNDPSSPHGKAAHAAVEKYRAAHREIHGMFEGVSSDQVKGVLAGADLSQLSELAKNLHARTPEEQKRITQALELLKSGHKADALEILAPLVKEQLGTNHGALLRFARMAHRTMDAAKASKLGKMLDAADLALGEMQDVAVDALNTGVHELLPAHFAPLGTLPTGTALLQMLGSDQPSSGRAWIDSLEYLKLEQAAAPAAVALALAITEALVEVGKERREEEEERKKRAEEREAREDEHLRQMAISVIERYPELRDSPMALALEQRDFDPHIPTDLERIGIYLTARKIEEERSKHLPEEVFTRIVESAGEGGLLFVPHPALKPKKSAA